LGEGGWGAGDLGVGPALGVGEGGVAAVDAREVISRMGVVVGMG